MSSEAAMVVAKIIPIHVLAIERAYIEWAKRNGTEMNTARKDAKENALQKW